MKEKKNSIIKSVKCRVSAKLWKKKMTLDKKKLIFSTIKCDIKKKKKKNIIWKIGGTKKAEDSYN